MIRNLLTYAIAWFSVPVSIWLEVGPLPRWSPKQEPAAPEAPMPDRYVRHLEHLDLARADGLLGYAFGNETSGILWGQFTKSADSRWLQ